MLGLKGYSGSLPLYYLLLLDIICMFINLANKDACLLSKPSLAGLFESDLLRRIL